MGSLLYMWSLTEMSRYMAWLLWSFFPQIILQLCACVCLHTCAFLSPSEQCLVKRSHFYSCQLLMCLSDRPHDHWSCCCPGRDAQFAEKLMETHSLSSYWILNSSGLSRWTCLEREIRGYVLKQKELGLQMSGRMKHPAFRIIKDSLGKQHRFSNTQQPYSSYQLLIYLLTKFYRCGWMLQKVNQLHIHQKI